MLSKKRKKKIEMVLTLYAVSDGPPSLAVRMGLKLMNIDHDLVNINFNNGEHLTASYAQVIV